MSILLNEDELMELVSAIQEGELSAFNRLGEKILPFLSVFAHRFFRNPSEKNEIEEVLQEILIKLYRNLNGFRKESKFTTWLYILAKNCCLTRLKKKSTQIQTLPLEKVPQGDGCGDQGMDRHPDPSLGPEEKLIEKEGVQYILKSLQELPSLYGRILILREIQGLSYEEIAQIEQCSLSVVKTRIRRGRLLLLEKFKTHRGRF